MCSSKKWRRILRSVCSGCGPRPFSHINCRVCRCCSETSRQKRLVACWPPCRRRHRVAHKPQHLFDETDSCVMRSAAQPSDFESRPVCRRTLSSSLFWFPAHSFTVLVQSNGFTAASPDRAGSWFLVKATHCTKRRKLNWSWRAKANRKRLCLDEYVGVVVYLKVHYVVLGKTFQSEKKVLYASTN